MSGMGEVAEKDTIEALMATGFSDYESRAYCALLAQSPANGYQVSQRSGIPRAKVYEILERLAMRGAAVRVESLDPSARLYAATDPRELLESMEKRAVSACERARKMLERYQGDPRVVEVLWRVTSQRDLIARGRELAREARKTLHVALWAEEFEALLPSLLEAAERGVSIALILYDPHRGIDQLHALGAGAILHSRTKLQAVPTLGRQFAMVADQERCITGTIFPQGKVEGVFTLNRGLVVNAIDLVNHEIYLERILSELGDAVRKVFGRNLGRLDAFSSPPKK